MIYLPSGPRLIKPRKWQLQGGASSAPSTWRGARNNFPLWEGAGTQGRDYGSLKNHAVLTSPVWTMTCRGLGLKGNGSSTQLAATGHQLTSWTHEVLFIPTTTTSQPILGIAETPGDLTTDRTLGINSSGQYVVYVFDGAEKRANSTRTAVSGQPAHIFGTHDATTLRLWLDGVLAGSVAAGAAYAGYASPELVGLYGSADGAAFPNRGDGTIVFIRVYPWALSSAQIKQRTIDPFAWMRPQRRRLWLDVVADDGGGGGFQPAWAAYSNVLLTTGRAA